MTSTKRERRLKFWGWGYEDEQPRPEELNAASTAVRAQLGFAPAPAEAPVALADIELPRSRLAPPPSLLGICSSDRYERVRHSYGKSYRDLVRAFRGRIDHPIDVVARPRQERDLEALLEWCAAAGAAAIPYGGGTSVVGGVEPRISSDYAGAVSIDMRALDRVLEIDSASRAARIQAGASGPRLEEQLRPHGLTLRHYPQSYEFSTLGGWIATRAGGHFATLQTHIDDIVESVRAVTPQGIWESRRLPGSGAGPSPDRMLIGSEGTLGVITEAWVRVQARPRFRASASISFERFLDGSLAVRALAQSGLWPSNCRLLDATEAALTGVSSDGTAVLVVAFESADHPLEAWMKRALECCTDHGGVVRGQPRYSDSEAPAAGEVDASSSTWRAVFMKAPYLRDTLIAAGVLSETFETAHVWRDLDEFVAEVRESAKTALAAGGSAGTVSCRFTHAYPDGAAPYFTVLAPARRGAELEQWAAVKEAASEAIMAAGGTITHHHAVGRDHRAWYDHQRPAPFMRALRAAKRELDPHAVLNPGVLFDPARSSGACAGGGPARAESR